MPKRSVWGLVLPVAVAASIIGAAAPQFPSLSQVLERVALYIDGYASAMALVIGTEHYSQEVVDSAVGRPAPASPAVSATKAKRTLVSEFALVRAGDDWLGFRDVYEVDGAAVGDRPDRLRTLFIESPSTAFAQARRIADESARYNIGSIQRNFNTPTTALLFFQRKNQERFRFKRAGEESVGGAAAWKLEYKETQKPTIVRTPSGKDVPVSGLIWLDPADGRVLKTSINIETELHPAPTPAVVYLPGQEPVPTPVAPRTGTAQPAGEWTGRAFPRRAVKSSVTVTVTYEPDPRLQLLVPAKMRETYELLEGQRTTAHATYSDFKRFETATRVIIK